MSVEMREDCWNRAVETFGTARIFEARARTLRRNLRLVTFFGIAVPVTVGAVIVSFGTNAYGLKALLFLAGILSVAQIIATAWSLVAHWDTDFAYCLESTTDNDRLSVQYQKLAKNLPADASVRVELLETANQSRVDADNKQGVSDSEKRFGMRVALHRFQRRCVCGEVPNPLAPSSSCAVCGDV